MIAHCLPDLKMGMLKSISPSRYIVLKECELRAIWEASVNRRLLPGSPAAKLGDIVHRFFENVVKGSVTSLDRSDLKQEWDRLVDEAQDTMRMDVFETKFVPLSRFVRGFDVSMYRCFNFAKRLSAIKACDSPGFMKWACGAEIPVRFPNDENYKFSGKIDLVRQTPNGPEIVDYKTGKIFDDEDGEVKAGYQAQLKLYAAIYEKLYGCGWPIKLTLIGMDGNEVDVPCTQEECVEMFEDAERLLDDVNSRLAGSAPEDFASPSTDSCKFCGFRPACKSYWGEKPDLGEWKADVEGCITRCQTVGNGTCFVELEGAGTTSRIKGLDPVRFDLSGAIGQEVRFYNLGKEKVKGSDVPGSYVPTAYTVAYLSE